MAEKVERSPGDFHTITPDLIVSGACAAIESCKKAFGAVEKYRMSGPGGSILHAEIYVSDVDAGFKRALEARAKQVMGVENVFWGDRYGVVVDPFGSWWSLATHVEDVPTQEIEKRMKAMMATQ